MLRLSTLAAVALAAMLSSASAQTVSLFPTEVDLQQNERIELLEERVTELESRKVEAPAPQPQVSATPKTAASSNTANGSYQGYGWWDFPGGISDHLTNRSGLHGLSPSQIAGMGQAELEILHSEMHDELEGSGGRQQAVATVSSNCPGGVCPVDYVQAAPQEMVQYSSSHVTRSSSQPVVRSSDRRVRAQAAFAQAGGPIRGIFRALFSRLRCR